MKKKQLVFRPTGEVRPPQKGEWILSEAFILNRVDTTFTECKYPIYSAVEEVIDVPLWRAGKRQEYFYIHELSGKAELYHDDCDSADNGLYERGNYFQSAEEAQKYADLMKFILTERLLGNPEFSAMVEKLKGELQ